MDSMNNLNLRVDECSFLDTVNTEIKRFIEIWYSENKKQVVLVFPPLSARKRFLIHTLVKNLFNELNTISIGISYGRRTVVYHSSLKPMLHETESEQSNEIQNEKNNVMQRAYRTPIERNAQEQLFKSFMPRKNVDKRSEPTVRKKSKRPDIPIYIPRAMRGLDNNMEPNTNKKANSSNSTKSTKCDTKYKIQDKSSLKIPSEEERKNSFSKLYINNKQNNCTLASLDMLISMDTSNEILSDYYINDEIKNSLDISPQNSISSSSSDLSNCINNNECNSNLLVSNEIIKPKSPLVEKNGLERVKKSLEPCDNVSISLDLPLSSSDNLNSTFITNSNLDKLSDSQISSIDHEVKPIVSKSWSLRQSMALNVVDNIEKPVVENIDNSENNEINSGNEYLIKRNISNETKLETEYDTNCPNFSLDDSFSSEPLSEIEQKSINNVDEKLSPLEHTEFVNKSFTSLKQNVQQEKNNKKVLDVEECSWEDLYDKEDDYIHPILMKELASKMGKVQVQCTKEDYRNHQTIEERSGDGDCVIEVYDFSANLKTVDLMNQFAAFRRNHLEIIWINDTHALAVFENPNLADRALNTPFALVKTRPLKNAIRESQIRAETVAPPPAVRPKTCTAMARRLVGSALGLKVNVPHHRLSAERTLLADAKEKKIRDAQLKNDIWETS